jgi:hypothetical protein
VQFGGFEPGNAGSPPNCLMITKGWCYLVRMYRPRAEVLGGKWKFPEAEAARGSLAAGAS